MSQPGTEIRRKRIPEIDFWRGVALIVILIDHIPWNGLDYLTPQNFGFSDAAEAFVFLSGVSVCLAYAPSLQKAGFRDVVNRCATRVIKIYFVQIALVVCSIAIPLSAAKIVGDDGVALGLGLSQFFSDPVSAALGAVTLTYMPGYSAILPLYVVLLVWAPIVILVASRNPALALLASLCIYVAGRGRFGGHPEGWFFNPLAWQLVFTIGVVSASVWRNGMPRPDRRLVALALAFILGAAILSLKAMGLKAAAFATLTSISPTLASCGSRISWRWPTSLQPLRPSEPGRRPSLGSLAATSGDPFRPWVATAFYFSRSAQSRAPGAAR